MLVTEGQLRYHAASLATVAAKTPLGAFKLFKIAFGKDGSIYLPFPYLNAKRGLLSEADPEAEPDPKVLRLAPNGRVVDYDVKFTHHTSGIVQFSKTGEAAVLPRRQGFRLDGPIGRLFDFRFYWLRGFETLRRQDLKKNATAAIDFSNRHPTSIRVWAEWRRKSDIIQNLDPAAAVVGPTSVAEVRATGEQVRFLFLGQPKGYPLRDHLVLISAEEIPGATGADDPTAIFMGGWDAHEGGPPNTPRMLVFMYPYTGPDAPSEATP